MPHIELKNVSKAYGKVQAIDKVNLEIIDGEYLTMLGPSGCGKTTTLRAIAGLLKPDEGEILIKDFDVVHGNPKEIADFRFYEIAMINQVNNLFSQYSVVENMVIPRVFNEQERLELNDLPEIAESVEIKHKLNQYGAELSAGERQRAALAVALARKSPIIFADEPSANLDSRLARNIISLMISSLCSLTLLQRMYCVNVQPLRDTGAHRAGLRVILPFIISSGFQARKGKYIGANL